MHQVLWGLFSYLSFMECYHGILSMAHSSRELCYGMSSHLISLEGIGYLEKDWGTSFPAAYLWVQCNRFEAPDVRFFSQQQTFLFRNGFFRDYFSLTK